LRFRQERRRLRMAVAPEAEDDGGPADPLREVRERRHPDPAADEERALDVEAEAVPEGTEHMDAIAPRERAERLRPRADGFHEERKLARGRQAQRERARKQPARRL